MHDIEPGDTLNGADPISQYLEELLGRRVGTKTVYHWAAAKKIPVGHFGGHLIASRKVLRDHFARLTGRAA